MNRKIPVKLTFNAPIKLTMSGGGYRASAFHLGTISFLEEMRLLDQVDMLSTVSGGSITGMRYVLSIKQGERFGHFYAGMRAFLEQSNMMEMSLDIVGKKAPHTRSGDYTIITAFAEIYDTHITNKARFGALWEGRPIHLKEIIFNATEFRTGRAFRFQKSESPGAIIGNKGYAVPVEIARQVRLADILAASSCFPGGCEPIAFPGDFKWPASGARDACIEMFGGKCRLWMAAYTTTRELKARYWRMNEEKTKLACSSFRMLIGAMKISIPFRRTGKGGV